METLEYLLSIDLNYIVIGLIAVFFTLEQILSTQFPFQRRGYHFLNSFLFQVLFLIGNLFLASVTVLTIEWFNHNEVGLFYLIELPLWLKLLLGLAMIDLVTYWFHRTSHRFPILWRFHRVHHSDTSMDSSTYFRAHPIETFFWFGSSPILGAVIFGLDSFTIGFYFLVLTPFLILEHSNLRFPVWLDKTAGLIFTTPNLHKIHHDQDQNYTDSNFADIFILWDRIFGTFKYKPADQIKFGLQEFEEERKQTFWYLLKAPFLTIERKVKE
jgi:sterol desaturase/sphingolipid hydroxylase (fatty acid hydroxylase superfamily)